MSLSLSETQIYIFPIVLLLFHLLFTINAKGLIKVLPVFALTLWILGFLLLSLKKDNFVVLAMLEDDQKREVEIDFFRMQKTVSNLYGMDRISLASEQFNSKDEFTKFLIDRGAKLGLYGNTKWTKVIFLDALSQLFLQKGKEAHIGSYDYGRFDLLLSSFPEEASIPLMPVSLSAHFVSWLAYGLDRNLICSQMSMDCKKFSSLPKVSIEKIRAKQEDYFFQAASVDGKWLSSSPRSIARFFLASSYMFSNTEVDFNQSEVDCAILALQKAIAPLRRNYEPELYSSIANNLGVFTFESAKTTEEIDRAKKIFRKTSQIKNSRGFLTKGAMLSQINLFKIENLNY